MSKDYTVSQVAAMTGASVRQIKHWDNEGILSPARTGENVANNRRLFSDDDVDAVRDILLMRELDMSLPEIKRAIALEPDKRAEIFAAQAEHLKAQYELLQQRILLADIAHTQGIEPIRSDLCRYKDASVLAQSYARDENLQMLTRWLKSRTERDISELLCDLAAVSKKFEAISFESDVEWAEVELVLIEFCDVWSKRFGWPTVGEMLQLAFAFDDADTFPVELSSLINADTFAFMSQAFFLAWVSATLEAMDAAFVQLYMDLGATKPEEKIKKIASSKRGAALILQSAQIFEAIVCECGGNPHLTDMPQSAPERAKNICLLAENVINFLEDAVLDDFVQQYLELDDFTTIDQQSLQLTREIVCAYSAGELDCWLQKGGEDEIGLSTLGWRIYMHESWLEQKLEKLGKKRYQAWRRSIDYKEFDAEFGKWLDGWVKENFDDFPEARWATVNESCEKERENREYLQLLHAEQ